MVFVNPRLGGRVWPAAVAGPAADRAGNGVAMSGNEWDGAPQGGDSWAGYEPQAAAGEPAAEHQPPTAIGQPTFGSEPWYANRAPLEPHPNWYQPVPPPRRRRRGRVLAAAGAAAVVIIGAVAAAVIMSPKSNSPHASSPPKSSSPQASSSSSGGGSASSPGTGPRLTATQVVIMASHKSAQLRSVSATVTEQISGVTSVTISGKVTEQRNPLLLSMQINESTGGTNIPISAILTTDAIYLKFNGTSIGMPASLAHKWIKIPLTELSSVSVFATLMRLVHNENPVSQTELLLAAEHLRAVGTADVGGVTTTRYAGWFSPSVAIKYLPPSARTALGPALKLISGQVDVNVWIDAQHHIRQFTEVEHVQSSTVTVTSRFSEFNAPVHINLPPASEVVTPPASALSGAG